MKLKTRFWVYLAVVHLVALGVGAWFHEALGPWFLLLEAGLLLSLWLGLRLVRLALEPLEFVRAFSDVVTTGEFNARYSSIGQVEMDQLIQTYNHMLERLQNERLRIGEQRGFMDRFLSVTRMGILILDFDHKISLASPSAVAFLPELDRVDSIHSLTSDLGRLLAGLAREETRLFTDSSGRRLRCRRSEFFDRGFARGYLTVEEMTEELNRSEKDTYEKLIRMMSHEVSNTVAATNSLLQSCGNYADQISNHEDRADFVGALDVLIGRNRSLNEFTQAFANLVRLPEPELVPVQLADLINPLVVMFRPQCGPDVELVLDLDPDLPLVRLDRNLMEQALINIMKNAIEAVAGSGNVAIRVHAIQDSLELTIQDSGGGLSAEIQNNLFKPFYTTKQSGQGLGLTLVREVLSQHQFKFSLTSQGEGALFAITMPAEETNDG